MSAPGPIAVPTLENMSSSLTENHHNPIQDRDRARVYHPPQAKFPIRVCSMYNCGVVLTRHRDGVDGFLCARHRVEVDLASRVNPYPQQQQVQQRMPKPTPRSIDPYPARNGMVKGKGKGKERAVSTPLPLPSSIAFGQALALQERRVHSDQPDSKPRHQLHTLTALQRSLLAQSGPDAASASVSGLPPLIPLPLPHPTPLATPPMVHDHRHGQRLDIEAAIAKQRMVERERARLSQPPPPLPLPRPGHDRAAVVIPQTSQNAPRSHPHPVGRPFPFGGDGSGRTIYAPTPLPQPVAHPQPPIPIPIPNTKSSFVHTRVPVDVKAPVDDHKGVDFLHTVTEKRKRKRRASSLPPCFEDRGCPSLLGKRKRTHRGEDKVSGRAASEPLPSTSVGEVNMNVKGWDMDVDVDINVKKEPVPPELDLVAAVGSAVQDVLSTIDLSGLQFVYPPYDPMAYALPLAQPSNPYPKTPSDPSSHNVKKSIRRVPHFSYDRAIPTHIPKTSRSNGVVIPTSASSSSPQDQMQIQIQPSKPPPMPMPRFSPMGPQIRTCLTPGCTGLIKPGSTSKRCSKCVMSSWKARKPPPRPSSSVLKKTQSTRTQRKSVTWADGWKSGGDGDGDEELGSDEIEAIEEDVRREGEGIPGWDSDLTDLSSSSEEEEEESSEESSDESDTPSSPVITGFKIRIPSRARLSSDGPASPMKDKEIPPLVVGTLDEVTNPAPSPVATPSPTLPATPSTLDPNVDQATPPPSESPIPTSVSAPELTPSLRIRISKSASSTPTSTQATPPPQEVSPSTILSETPNESATKPTPSPRIRISLSQLSKLKASVNVSPSPPLPPQSSASTSCSPTPAPTPAPTSTSTPSVPGRKCAIKKCLKTLPVGYSWKCCPECRTHHREYQRRRLGCSERYVADEYDRDRIKFPSGPSSLLTTKPLASSGPSFESGVFEPTPLRNCSFRGSNAKLIDMHNLLVPKARLCTIRACKHILPGPRDYKWKMCHPCRERTTRTRRIRQVKAASRGSVDLATIEDEVAPLQPLELDVTRIPDGRCPNPDCGVRLDNAPEETTGDSFVECTQCMWRKMSPEERKSTPIKLHDLVLVAPPSNKEKEESSESKPSKQTRLNPYPRLPPPKPRAPTAYPEYLSLSRLLLGFQELFSSFVQAQSFYVSYNHARDDPARGRTPARFSFDGEYSVVAPDFNVVRREKEVAAIVSNVKQEIERLGRLKFDPSTQARSAAYGGIITRYACQNQIPISVPSSAAQSALHPKVMRGELEVVVLPDDSHSFIPGQRTVVRFRLVG
ncbi:hypothetical protein V5O48_017482 [Marasmius crinis-equi]|uniref:Uncharacterized protein n=1 Tax=Marasmius crinis-equi TaxID=585013 RepID=A0ABR3ENW5_9AGAR